MLLAPSSSRKLIKKDAAANHSELNADLILNKVYTEEDFGTEGRGSSRRLKQITKNLQTSSHTVIDSTSVLDLVAVDRQITKRESHEKLRIINDLSENQESYDADDPKMQTVFRKTNVTKINSSVISQVDTLLNSPNNH